MKTSLARKLITGFLAVAVIGFLTAAVGIHGLRDMESALTDVVERKWVTADMSMEYWIGALTKVWSQHRYMEGELAKAHEANEWAAAFVRNSLEELRAAALEDRRTIDDLEELDRKNDDLRREMLERFTEEQRIRAEFWSRAREMDRVLRELETEMDGVAQAATGSGDPAAAQRASDAADATKEIWIGVLSVSTALGMLDAEEREPALEKVEWADEFIEEQLAGLRATGQVTAERVDRIRAQAKEQCSLVRDIFVAKEAFSRAMRELDENTDGLRRRIEPIEHENDEMMNIAVKDAAAKAHGFRTALLLVTLVGAMAAVGIGLFIARGVTVPLRELSRAARDIAYGRLDRRVLIDSKDEIGDLAHAFNGMARDLSESNARLQQSEAAYRNLFDNAVVGLYRTDHEGSLQVANFRFLEILGLEGAGTAGAPAIPEWFAEPARWSDLLAQIESLGEVRDYETEFRRPDGRRLYVVLSARRDPASGTIEGSLQDITRRRLLEQQIIQNEKLSAIGQLAAGISHEMRNPLGIVSNVLYDLRQIVDLENPEIREDLSIATEELNRLNAIIGNLLEFSRESGSEPEPIDVNRLVERTLQLMAKSLTNQNIRVETQLLELPPARFNQNAFKQVFINLVTNAAQAMPDGGRLAIRTRLLDGRVDLEVEDTGMGIPPQDIRRIFDPFFTTKAAGKGTGLGLSIAHSMLRKYDADIRVRSFVGKGTTFNVQIPVAESAGADAAPTRAAGRDEAS